MKLAISIVAIAILLAAIVTAGKVSHMEYNPNARLYYYYPGAGSQDVCHPGTAKCQDNTYLLCQGGQWKPADSCTKNEACTPAGCKMIRWSRYPYVKISPIASPGTIYRNLTSRSMAVQVKI